MLSLRKTDERKGVSSGIYVDFESSLLLQRGIWGISGCLHGIPVID